MSWHFRLWTDLSAFPRTGWQSLVTLIADVRGKHWSLSLSLLSCFFLSLSPLSLSLHSFMNERGCFTNKVIRWVSASLIFIWFVLGTAIWKETGIVGRVNRERVPSRHLQKSRGNYPGTDANCVYNYWHLCKWAALAIRREVYHNLSRCFVLRFSDWRGCWEIGTFCHLNHGLP